MSTAGEKRNEPLVAIVLATFDPPETLFERQVASIQRQEHEHFVCIVNDDGSDDAAFRMIVKVCEADDRFRVSRNEHRLGFYRNFERSLSLVPPEATYVALSDQDDYWRPDKLRRLLREFERHRVLLAFGDMKIVTETGDLVAASYWSDRRLNYTDLASLLLLNTVTGSASVFRRDLLLHALPFPPDSGSSFHDHWIACVALTLGEIAFVAQPLQDYVQHGGNVVGRRVLSPDELKGGLVGAARRFAARPRHRLTNSLRHARTYYERDVLARQAIAVALLERLGPTLTPEQARAIERVARLSSSLGSLAWLVARSARDVRGESETLGIENQLVKGILWHDTMRAKAALRRAT